MRPFETEENEPKDLRAPKLEEVYGVLNTGSSLITQKQGAMIKFSSVFEDVDLARRAAERLNDLGCDFKQDGAKLSLTVRIKDESGEIEVEKK